MTRSLVLDHDSLGTKPSQANPAEGAVGITNRV